jgi:carbonic anhydrase
MIPDEQPTGFSVSRKARIMTRRRLVSALGLTSLAASAGAFAAWQRAQTAVQHHGFSLTTPQTATEALTRLQAGNECYIAEHFDVGNQSRTTARRLEVAPAQHPYAIILACADSRVSPEVIFSAGLGDLFVVRVAGNIVDPKCLGVLGSIEYAIAELKIPLVLILGHENCGAVKAAIHAVERGSQPQSAIRVLTDAIGPVIASVAGREGDLLVNAVEANARQQAKNLLLSEEVIAPAVDSGKVQIVSGVYELLTGRVRLLH